MRKKKFKFSDSSDEYAEIVSVESSANEEIVDEAEEIEIEGNYEDIRGEDYEENIQDWEEETYSALPVQQGESFLDENILLLIILFFVLTGPKKDMSLIIILLLLLID